MAPPTRDAFVRRLRELDREALVRFVADLESARGGTVERTDGGLLVERPTGERRRLAVTTDRRPTGVGDGTDPGIDAVVVARAVAGDALPDGVRVVDASDLHAMALYAVDRNALPAILDRHFGSDAFTDTEPGGGRYGAGTVGRVCSRASDVLDRATGVAVVALAAVALAAVLLTVTPTVVPWVGSGFDDAGPAVDGRATSEARTTDPGTTGGRSTPDPTASPAVPADALDATDRTGNDCPRPPRDAHPAALRPEPVAVASDFGLDGWTIRSATNVTVFRGPNELSAPHTPEVRHETTYRDPSRATVVLTVDRWADANRAAESATALATTRPAALRWGRYTLGAAVYRTSEGRRSDTEQVGARDPTATARTLLSHVTLPDGRQLGGDCVSRLVVAPNATE